MYIKFLIDLFNFKNIGIINFLYKLFFYCYFCTRKSLGLIFWSGLRLTRGFAKILLIILIFCTLHGSELFESSAQKPNNYISCLLDLKQKQDDAFFNNKFNECEHISKQIGALLTFQDYQDTTRYSFRLATREEAKIILSLVAQTRKIYKGKVDIIRDFYFGDRCKERIKKDYRFAQHMAALIAADAICYSIFNNRSLQTQSFEDCFNQQRKDVNNNFVSYIKQTSSDIHGNHIHGDPNFTSLLEKLSKDSWHSLTKRLRAVLDIFAPEINFLELFADLSMSSYKDWNVHLKSGVYTDWDRDKNQNLKEIKQSFLSELNSFNVVEQAKEYVMATTLSTVLLTEDCKKHFQEIDKYEDINLDGNTVGAEYSICCNVPGRYKYNFIIYLTRKLGQGTSPINKITCSTKERINNHRIRVKLLNQGNNSEKLRQSSELGSVYATAVYAHRLFELQRFEEAFKYYKLAADFGDTNAQTNCIAALLQVCQELSIKSGVDALKQTLSPDRIKDIETALWHAKIAADSTQSAVYQDIYGYSMYRAFGLILLIFKQSKILHLGEALFYCQKASEQNYYPAAQHFLDIYSQIKKIK